MNLILDCGLDALLIAPLIMKKKKPPPKPMSKRLNCSPSENKYLAFPCLCRSLVTNGTNILVYWITITQKGMFRLLELELELDAQGLTISTEMH